MRMCAVADENRTVPSRQSASLMSIHLDFSLASSASQLIFKKTHDQCKSAWRSFG